MTFECQSCKECGRCPAESEFRRVSVFAWAKDAEMPACPFYQPDYFRGVEGVFRPAGITRGLRVA